MSDEKSPVQPNLTLMRDEECIPVAKEILRIIASKDDLALGSSESLTEVEAMKYYKALYQSDIAPLLVKHNIKVKDINFIFQVSMQSLQLLMQISTSTVDTRYDQAVAKVMGVEEADEVRISNIQDVLVEKEETIKENVV